VTDRAHFYAPIQDGNGDIQPNSVVRVLQPGTETLIAAPVYADNTTTTALSNPFVSVDGAINFYLDVPQRIRLGVTKPGFDEVFFEDIDVLVDATTSIDQSHTGQGTNSMTIGSGSTSTGAGSVALGNSASAAGDETVAAGHSANAASSNAVAVGSAAVSTGTGGTAVGKGAVASATNAVAAGILSAATGNNTMALGDNAVASSAQATALGSGASSAKLHATAVGAQAAATEDNQVMLGTVNDFADIPNFATLKSPNGTKYRLYVRDDGTLNIRYHWPMTAINELTTGSHDDDFEGSNGSWAATTGALTNSSVYARAGTRSMLMTASGTGAYATSLKVAAVAGHTYVGKAQMFRHAGDGTATQFQAWLLFYDGTNTLIGSAVAGPIQTIVNDTWMPIDVRTAAPALAATVALQVGVPTGTGSSGGKWYVDVAGIFDIPTTT
jgi:hypothetical protein